MNYEFAKSIHKEKLSTDLVGSGPRLKLPFKPTAERPLILSTSELGSFTRCRLQWHWAHRVGLRMKGFGIEQSIGILVHDIRAAWYALPPIKRTVTAMEKLALKALFKFDGSKIRESKKKGMSPAKAKELARAMSVGFAEWALDEHDYSDEAIGLRDARTTPEGAFWFPITKDRSVIYRGYIDLRFEPTIFKKTLAMEETKTKAGISFDMLDLNDQLSAYLAALRFKYPGYKRYIAWRTVLRRQMPGPRVKAALFGRESIERSDDEIEQWVKDTRRKATDLLDAAVYPVQNDSCRWSCDFYNLCVLRSTGGKDDVANVIKTEYDRKSESAGK